MLILHSAFNCTKVQLLVSFIHHYTAKCALMHILTPLRLVGLGVVLTRLVGRCTLGMLASLLALTYVSAYRLLLRHL
jgi:hypothetical protein